MTTFNSKAHRFTWASKAARCAALVGVAATIAVAVAGCAKNQATKPSDSGTKPSGSAESTETYKGHGLVTNIAVTDEMRNSKPLPQKLDNPTDAVRSYLDWVSYAYRMGDSNLAAPMATGSEFVRVDAYVQWNLQEKSRLLDQELVSLQFGSPVVTGAKASVPATEKWTYRYLSTTEAGKQLGDPESIDYATTYHLVRNQAGDWQVDSIEAQKTSGK